MMKYRLSLEDGYQEFATEAAAIAAAQAMSVDPASIVALPLPAAPSQLASISARQIRLALLAQEVSLDTISTTLAELDEPTRSTALITWEYATRFERDDPLADLVATALGWTAEQMDELWTQARSL